MVLLLRKWFIKDYQQVQKQEVRKAHGILAAIGGMVVNLLLFAIKILIGVITGSMSIVSDAINNLTDLFSCFVNLFGFKIAGKKPDSKHPYGYERTEYIAGMIISFVIIAVGIVLAYSAVTSLISLQNSVSYTIWAFIILGVSIVGKILLGVFYYGLGKAIDSVTLKASMKDSFNDSLSTGVVLIAAIIQYYFSSLWWIDGAMSLIVSILIVYAGISSVKETASPLIGLTPKNDFVQAIVKDIKSYKGVLGIHDLMVHSYGPSQIFMTIHIEVDGYKNSFENHDLMDVIEAEISKKYGIVITAHMDPIDTKNKELALFKEEVKTILYELDPVIQFHDLRMVAGPTHTNIIFDIVLPMKYKITPEEVIDFIKSKVEKTHKNYYIVINVDRDYIGKE